MQPSPLQLKEYNFTLVHVKAREDVSPSSDGLLDMDGVTIDERIQWGVADQDPDDPLGFGLKLYVGILNEAGKTLPYDIEVEVQGLFVFDPVVPKEKRESLLMVNGSAILYSVMREQVLSLTARGAHGPVMLPTVNFLDHKQPKATAATE